MRKFAMLLALISTSAFAGDRSFDFMNLNTSNHYSGKIEIAGKSCKLRGQKLEECERSFGAVIGTVQVILLKSKFNDGFLYSVSGQAFANNFQNLKKAFENKYGEPSQVSNPIWRNKIGTAFDNEVVIWEFANGTLELRARGYQRDMSEFEFVSSENSPANPPPPDQPVNF